MPTIDEAVAHFLADQAPVLCLDTCDFLDVLRVVAEGDMGQVASFRKIFNQLGTHPRKFHLSITYLVKHEWKQNIDGGRVQKALRDHLHDTNEEMQNLVARIRQARDLADLPAVALDTSSYGAFFDVELIRSLTSLAESVMDGAVVLEKDDMCVARALDRVMLQARPSHKNEIKDSIHWEHYLELCRNLGAAGHAHDRIFVSANRADFWADLKTPTIHPDLKDEADTAGLRFFGRLDQALRVLGV